MTVSLTKILDSASHLLLTYHKVPKIITFIFLELIMSLLSLNCPVNVFIYPIYDLIDIFWFHMYIN